MTEYIYPEFLEALADAGLSLWETAPARVLLTKGYRPRAGHGMKDVEKAKGDGYAPQELAGRRVERKDGRVLLKAVSPVWERCTLEADGVLVEVGGRPAAWFAGHLAPLDGACCVEWHNGDTVMRLRWRAAAEARQE